ncbi:response regulator [Flavobacterium sp. 3HN19-14]|uniref:response regulator n=1 Tax=Flavobacterium sp. 3HN19-14 TaxID=3448133 RepID=UPI003EE140F7
MLALFRSTQEIHSDINLTIINDGVTLMEKLEDIVPPPPEVIFLDLNMPLKNGFECLIEIRNTPKLKDIPVVIYSTSSNKDIVEKTFQHGANFYICKPATYNALKKTIAHVLSFDFNSMQGKTERSEFVINVA